MDEKSVSSAAQEPPPPPPATPSAAAGPSTALGEAADSAVAPMPLASAAQDGHQPQTPWEEAFLLWKTVDLKAKMPAWDEAFGQVVVFKEDAQAERGRLVSYVKEFIASYKAEPTTAKVEELLRFFKRFVQTLYDRINVSERHFLAIYQTFAPAPDPAPLLLSAHLELSAQHRRIAQLATRLEESRVVVGELRRQLLQASSDASRGGDTGRGGVAGAAEVTALERAVDQLQERLAASAREADTLRAEAARLAAAGNHAQEAALRAAGELERATAIHDAELAELEGELQEMTSENAGLRQQLRQLQQDAESLRLGLADESSSGSGARGGTGDREVGGALAEELAAETKCRMALEVELVATRERLAQLQSTARTAAQRATIGNHHQQQQQQQNSAPEGDLPQEALRGDAAAQPSTARAAMAEKKVARTLQFELENTRTRAAEAAQVAESTIANLRRQVEELRGAIPGFVPTPAGVAEVESHVAAASGGAGLEALEASIGSSTPSTRAALEGSTKSIGAGGGDYAPHLPDAFHSDPTVVAALLQQRNALKARLEAAELATARLRTELLDARAQCDGAMRDNELLRLRAAHLGAGGSGESDVVPCTVSIGGSADVGGDGDGLSGGGGGASRVGNAGAPAMAGGVFREVAAWQHERHERRSRPSNARRSNKTSAGDPSASRRGEALGLFDSIAGVIASMIVGSSAARAFLVSYIVALHLFLLGVLYYTSSRYFHHTAPLRGEHSGAIHGDIGRGT